MRFSFTLIVGLVIFSIVSLAPAETVSVRKVVFSPGEDYYYPGQVLNLLIDVVNERDEAVRNVTLDVSVNGREVYSGVFDLNGSRIETVKIPSSLFDKDWNPFECGSLEFKVYLEDSIIEEDFRVTGKFFKDLSIKPENIFPGNYTEIMVLDENGIHHPAAKVGLTNLGSNLKWDSSDDYFIGRTWDGLMRVLLNEEFEDPYGRYQIDVWALGYCRDTVFFSVEFEKSLSASFFPDTVKPYESASVYVVDESGVPVSNAKVSIFGNTSEEISGFTGSGGYYYFSVDNPGGYTLSIEVAGYPKFSKDFFVSSVPFLGIVFPEDEALVGVVFPIVVSSGGNVVSNVNVTVSSFNESDFFYEGNIIFTPPQAGEYSVSAWKEGFIPVTGNFTVINKFDLEVIQLSWDKREVLIKASDHLGKPVSIAKVSLENSSSFGLTDRDGFVSFSLPLRDVISLKAEKEGFIPETIMIKPNKTLYINFESKEINIGERISFFIRDDFGDDVISEITITNPDGSRERVVKDKHVFTPESVGEYSISVSGEGYSPASFSVRVNPNEIDLSLNVSGEIILIFASSGREPIGGLRVWIDAPSGMEYVILNSRGYAEYEASSEGVYGVYVNNSLYEFTRKTVYIEGEGFPFKSLVLVLLIILIVALIVSRLKIPVRKEPKQKKSLRNL